MSSDSAQQLAANRSRLIKDKLAKYGVTLGGTMVLVALLLIFFYLLYVVEPIFRSVELDPQQQFDLPGKGQTLVMGMEEQSEVGYRFTDSGEMIFFATQPKKAFDREPGDILLEEQVVGADEMVSFAKTLPVNHQYAVGTKDGKAWLFTPTFDVSFPGKAGGTEPKRLIEPKLTRLNDGKPLLIDQQHRALTKLAYETNDKAKLFVAQTADGKLISTFFETRSNFLTGVKTLVPHYNALTFEKPVDDLAIRPDLRQFMVLSGNQLQVFDVSISGQVTQGQRVDLKSKLLGKPERLQLLAGASSLLVAHKGGKVSQWFEVAGDQGREYQFIRSFKTAGEIKDIVVEYYRRTFYTVSDTGALDIFHTTSEADLYHDKPEGLSLSKVSVGPRANMLLTQSGDQLHLFRLHNEHPEVSWSGLWHKVWYEGYPEPTYTWQSTSGSDDFEPKFSLVPISFGTIKAAAYAMLFAVPIGLAAAVYTAYFMSPSIRKVVKPTVEIMEALPTVILGFLAGLWLAPLIEEYLPGIIAVLILLPAAIIGSAAIWSQFPERIRTKINDGRVSLLLIPVVVLVGWASFAMSPWLEHVLFDGNVRGYLTNELGINYDQRNSLVVGIAMGFAVIPTIFSIAEDAIFSVPKHLSNGSLALGATPWQTLMRVVLLTASPGIFSAVMMGLGRAVGETMIVLMATGNTPIMDWNIFEGMRTLSANIAVEMPESEVGSSHYRILFLAAFVLFIFTFIFNTVAEFVRQRLRDKYSSM
ncbi:phosphate ABC transporter permease [Idiomarina tyrosinivorans]|uniref:Phosphate ABC transporter permease n=1 Tax=Idiomarina tyrosinivorans TaxID=1445662 RepID=A0A432ZSF7_9GAMM|nr:ABC transporter permease subunit [Idiomarina tyrosinivorans]RUO80792.1 phosphate ABC transporter permease [Idiomarina tyrosinivorans]